MKLFTLDKSLRELQQDRCILRTVLIVVLLIAQVL